MAEEKVVQEETIVSINTVVTKVATADDATKAEVADILKLDFAEMRKYVGYMTLQAKHVAKMLESANAAKLIQFADRQRGYNLQANYEHLDVFKKQCELFEKVFPEQVAKLEAQIAEAREKLAEAEIEIEFVETMIVIQDIVPKLDDKISAAHTSRDVAALQVNVLLGLVAKAAENLEIAKEIAATAVILQMMYQQALVHLQ